MAKYDTEDGRPGSIGPDLGALDEDLLSADLEADLGGDIGDGTLDEGGLDDPGDADLDGEFEDSDDEEGDDDDEGGAFGGSGFSGGFGTGRLLDSGDRGGSGFSFGSGSYDIYVAGDDLFDFETSTPAPSVDDEPEAGPDFAAPAFVVPDHADFVAKADRPSRSDFVSGKRTKTDGKDDLDGRAPDDSDDTSSDLFELESPAPKTRVDRGDRGERSSDDGPDDADETSAPSVDDEPDSGPDFVAKADRPSPSDFLRDDHTKTEGTKADDEISGDDGSDVVRGHKGDDTVDGASGDDWLRGGHGDDDLTGGSGSDVIDGGKGDDTLNYTLGVNAGATDFYDGGKGSDTLKIKLDPAELTPELWEELQDLRDWMAETANVKRSTGHAFNDAAARSAGHPIYVTSFGLTLRNIEELEVEVEGYGTIDLDGDLPVFGETPAPEPAPEPEPEPAPEPEPKPEPEPEPTAEAVVVDIAADGPREPAPSTVDSTTSSDGALSVEALSVTLRPGSQATISVDVEVRELPAIYDVFLVEDLSGSFWDDLPNVKAQFAGLYDTLNADGDVQFGIGSFVDKPVETFGSTLYGDYVYQTHLGVTGDKAAIQESLDSLGTHWGYDWKESQLEALVQVALRGDEIGFRDGAQKFVVISTDAAAHEEGDYYWAPDGANNYDTVIDDEDFPAVEAVGALLEAAGVIPVFAVTAYVVDYYQALVDAWGFGSVTVLSSDSSNLATAITDGLKAATTDLNLSISGDDYGYVSSMTPGSYEDVGAGSYTFDITLEIPADSVDYSSDGMTLVIEGYGTVDLAIAIESVDATGDSGDDTLSGDDGVNGLYGLAGADTLDGRGGDDTLEGGSGDDTMTGGLGDDSFVFADGHGNDTITDFLAGAAGGDVIDLRRLTAGGSFTDVMAAAAQVGDDTVIDFDDGNSITLLGVDSTQLEEQDFLF